MGPNPGVGNGRAPSPIPAASLLDRLSTALWMNAGDGEILYANKAARSLLGAPRSHSLLTDWPTRLVDAEREDFNSNLAQRLSLSREFMIDVNVQLRSSVRQVRMKFTPDVDPDGKTVWVGEAWSRSANGPRKGSPLPSNVPQWSEEVRAVLKSDPGATVISDSDGLIVLAGGSCRKLTGYAPRELQGRFIAELMPSQHGRLATKYLRIGRRLGSRKAIASDRGELALLRKDGSEQPVSIWVVRFESDGKIYFSAHLSDAVPILDRDNRLRDLRGQLAHLARISAMGQLSAAIVHEISQPLSAVQSYTAGLKLSAASQDPARISTALEAIDHEIHRAKQITTRLRRFAQGREETRRPEDLVGLLDEALQIATLDNRQIALRKSYSTNLGTANCDRIQIQQVLVNLIRNAIAASSQAMTPEIVLRARRSHDRVSVTVEDNGSGVKIEDIAVLFLPFNTTKIDGMGLGLAISKSIIEAHGGHIWYEPRQSGGACFGFDIAVEAA